MLHDAARALVTNNNTPLPNFTVQENNGKVLLLNAAGPCGGQGLPAVHAPLAADLIIQQRAEFLSEFLVENGLYRLPGGLHRRRNEMPSRQAPGFGLQHVGLRDMAARLARGGFLHWREITQGGAEQHRGWRAV